MLIHPPHHGAQAGDLVVFCDVLALENGTHCCATGGLLWAQMLRCFVHSSSSNNVGEDLSFCPLYILRLLNILEGWDSGVFR